MAGRPLVLLALFCFGLGPQFAGPATAAEEERPAPAAMELLADSLAHPEARAKHYRTDLPSPPDSLLAFARRALDQGHYASAVELLESASRLRPNYRVLQLELASAYVAVGRLSDARHLYEQLVAGSAETSPLRIEALRGLASIYERSGWPEEALPFVEEALAVRPLDEGLRHLRKRLLLQVGPEATASTEIWNDSAQLRGERTTLDYRGGGTPRHALLVGAFLESCDRSSEPDLGKVDLDRAGDRLDGGGLRVGLRSRLRQGWHATAHVGSTQMSGRDAEPLYALALERRWLAGPRVSIAQSYETRGLELDSFLARSRGITGHQTACRAEAPLTPGLRGAVEMRLDRLSDRNRGFGIAARLSLGLDAGFSARAILETEDWRRNSDLYFAPRAATTALVGVASTHRLQRIGILAFDALAGRVRQDDSSAAAVRLSAGWQQRIFRQASLSAGWNYEQSLRDDPFFERRVTIGCIWSE